jgi:glycosyltransferase involved in cell wall biosynthesis
MTTANRPTLDVSVLICTYNRAALLGEMLDSLAAMRDSGTYSWEVIVVDNNSTDATRAAIESRQAAFPVPLRYIFESRQGKSIALNTGIEASTAQIILFTDDDQRVTDNWIDESCAPLFRDPALGYTGGPVRPIWDAARPAWLSLDEPRLLGPLGMFDYGSEPFIFEDRQRSAPGGNMAVRRTVIDRIGMFSPDLGRTGGSLLGQEQAEFFCRSREAGARGLYVPTMEVYHHVPPSRMTKSYFHRWWYWRGISRARVDRKHPLTEDGIDLTRVPSIGGMPRFMIADAWRLALKWLRCAVARQASRRMGYEMLLAHNIGYLREWRKAPAPSAEQRVGRSLSEA